MNDLDTDILTLTTPPSAQSGMERLLAPLPPPAIPFKASRPFTMGIELELQLLNRRNYNLATDALDLLAWIQPKAMQDQIKLEITQGMIELNSGVHTDVGSLIEELKELRAALLRGARHLNIDVAGGGAHPFQSWSEQRITPSERFHYLRDKYGYLAKSFTVFGQHIHVGVENGDDAIYLTHGFARYVPHFIALSAASPFHQGIDSAFDSSRSNVVRAFPLSGTMPALTSWHAFEAYYEELRETGIVGSMKDFYWDIRPKPEFGTVEIRVCDTPLTIEHAALLGAYAQMLARWLLAERPLVIDEHFYLLYQHNRFEASRYGLAGELALHRTERRSAASKEPIFTSVLQRLQDLTRFAQSEADLQVLRRLRLLAYERLNDAAWLRRTYRDRGSLSDTMRLSAQMWMGEG